TDEEWRAVFASFLGALRPGGSLWIVDHIRHDIPAIQEMMTNRWGAYLVSFQGEAYRDKVFAYTEKEDTPQTLLFQAEMLREVGFGAVDVLHVNTLYAAFGGRKAHDAGT